MELPNTITFFSYDEAPLSPREYDPDFIDHVELKARKMLPGWTITLLDEPPEDQPDEGEYWAVCEVLDNANNLRLYVTDDLLEQGYDEIDRTLTHEMLHPVFRELRFNFGYRDEDEPDETWVHYEELAVERLTHLLQEADGPRSVVGFER